jgi:hypothetical protein
MQLTAAAVQAIFEDCMFKEGEPTDHYIPVIGVVTNLGFHPERTPANKEKIVSLLHELPKDFLSSELGGGGGTSFLQAPFDKDNVQWGEQMNAEQLLCLGMAVKAVIETLPKSMRKALPGGVPYYTVTV